MEHLNPEAIAKLRERLLDERRQALQDLRANSNRHDDREVEPGDMQDLATDEADQRTGSALGQHEERRLREIDAALSRMELGTYGICEETGETIPLARLMAEPTTRYTVEALEQLEDDERRERTQYHGERREVY